MMPSNPTLAELPTLKAVNTIVRRVMVDRYGAAVDAHPVAIFRVDERTLDAIVGHHPHPAARAMATHFLRTGERRDGAPGTGSRVALRLPLGGALTLAKACFVAAEVMGTEGLRVLDDGLSIQTAILDRYGVSQDEIRRGIEVDSAAA